MDFFKKAQDFRLRIKEKEKIFINFWSKLRLTQKALLIILVFIIIPSAIAMIRGHVTSSTLELPQKFDDGVRCRLLKDSNENRLVRCASVVKKDMESVWNTVTDYQGFPDTFDNIFFKIKVNGINPSGERKLKLDAVVEFWLMDLPMLMDVEHINEGETRIATWNHDTGLGFNRGKWELRSKGPSETLVIYEIQAKINWVPQSLTNITLVDHLRWIFMPLRKG